MRQRGQGFQGQFLGRVEGAGAIPRVDPIGGSLLFNIPEAPVHSGSAGLADHTVFEGEPRRFHPQSPGFWWVSILYGDLFTQSE